MYIDNTYFGDIYIHIVIYIYIYVYVYIYKKIFTYIHTYVHIQDEPCACRSFGVPEGLSFVLVMPTSRGVTRALGRHRAQQSPLLPRPRKGPKIRSPPNSGL